MGLFGGAGELTGRHLKAQANRAKEAPRISAGITATGTTATWGTDSAPSFSGTLTGNGDPNAFTFPTPGSFTTPVMMFVEVDISITISVTLPDVVALTIGQEPAGILLPTSVASEPRRAFSLRAGTGYGTTYTLYLYAHGAPSGTIGSFSGTATIRTLTF